MDLRIFSYFSAREISAGLELNNTRWLTNFKFPPAYPIVLCPVKHYVNIILQV